MSLESNVGEELNQRAGSMKCNETNLLLTCIGLCKTQLKVETSSNRTFNSLYWVHSARAEDTASTVTFFCQAGKDAEHLCQS